MEGIESITQNYLTTNSIMVIGCYMKKRIEINITALRVKCPKCFYEWIYRGNSKKYITCSKCKYPIDQDKL